MSVTVTKNGATDISSLVDWSSVDSISVLTKERGTFQFSIMAPPASLSDIPAVGDTLSLADSSGTIFGGTVTAVEKTVRGQQGGLVLNAKVTATDYGFALDSKLVKKSYTDTDPADIVADLVSTFGPSGYNTSTYVKRGNFLVSSINFNYEQVTKCIQALATQIGWDWYVDPDKNLHFFFAGNQDSSTEDNPAPFDIDETNGKIDVPSIDIDEQITNLKNSVYVIGGSYTKEFTAATTPDVYTTVAGQVVYHIGYKYTGSFFVTLDGAEQSIGIDQQDDPSSYETLYNSGGPFIKFTSDPGAGHTLKVYGFAQIPIVAHVNDPASIGTYGTYEDSIIDSQITSVLEAQARAESDLAMFGHAVFNVKFNTRNTGLRVGQLIKLNSTLFGVSNYPLIIKRIEAIGLSPSALLYQVEAVGSDVVTMNDVLLQLVQQQNAATPVDQSTVIQILVRAQETLSVTDSVSVSTTTGPYDWGTPRWGFFTWN